MPRSNDQPNRVEINEKIVQVLGPEVQKLNEFMKFAVEKIFEILSFFKIFSLCQLIVSLKNFNQFLIQKNVKILFLTLFY